MVVMLLLVFVVIGVLTVALLVIGKNGGVSKHGRDVQMMRIFHLLPKVALASLAIAVSAPAAYAEGFAQKVTDTVNTGAQTAGQAVSSVPAYLLKPYLDNISRSSKNSQVQILFLTKYNLKLVEDRRCEPYVDLVQASAWSSYESNAAINKGLRANCFKQLTAYELLNPQIRQYWEGRRVRVAPNSKCVKYAAWSDEVVYGNFSDSEKDLALKKLFLDAEEKQCLNR